MSNLSLLVDCGKIIKWLQERKKLPKDWYNYVKAAEEKIKILLKDHQSFSKYEDIHKYLIQNLQNFSFYDLNNFIQMLLKTDIGQEKSMIFGYSDMRVKQWTNLKKFMQSKNLGMLNNAKFIQQSLKFDLPGFSKNIQMMDNQLSNLKRKIDFNENTIFQQLRQIKKQINTVGLQVDDNQDLKKFNIESQIPNIISKVPETIKDIQNFIDAQNINKLVNFYKQKIQKDGLKCEMPLLQYFLQNKNDYVDVFKQIIAKNAYENQEKYKQFMRWRPINEWEITIQNNAFSSKVQQLKLNYITLIEDRETRQQLLYDFNEVMYYFVGLRFQCTEGNKKLKLDNDQVNMTENQLNESVSKLNIIINMLSAKKLLTPLQLKNNKKSYQHFITKFHNIEKNIVTLEDQIRDYKKQIQVLEVERNVEVEKLRNYRKKIINVKKMEEKLLTDFIGKDVKITGEINKLE